MPTKDPSVKARNQRAAYLRAKTYVDSIRDKTPCAVCGRRMLDFHNPDHVANPQRRVSWLVSHFRSIRAIAAEIATCTPLCRRCHMNADRPSHTWPVLRGERNPNAKLTREQVDEIRAVARKGMYSKLARQYGVSDLAIRWIALGRSWTG